MEQDNEVIRCPKCGTIVGRYNKTCGVCGADLFQTPVESLGEAVQDEEKEELLATAELKKKELASAKKKLVIKLVAWVVDATLLVSGYLLLTSSQPGSTFDLTGGILFVLGIGMSLVLLGPIRKGISVPRRY